MLQYHDVRVCHPRVNGQVCRELGEDKQERYNPTPQALPATWRAEELKVPHSGMSENSSPALGYQLALTLPPPTLAPAPLQAQLLTKTPGL